MNSKSKPVAAAFDAMVGGGKSKANGDHKRKAIAIAPATVEVTADAITIVVPDVLGKNASHKTGKNGRRFPSEQTDAYRESVRSAVVAWRGMDITQAFGDGSWRLDVLGVWPTKRDRIAETKAFAGCPCGDADAAIPQALDALQRAGILDDDARVVAVRAWNMYRKDVRATVIRLVRVDPDVREREAASLVRLAEQVPPQVKPKRAKKTKAEVKP